MDNIPNKQYQMQKSKLIDTRRKKFRKSGARRTFRKKSKKLYKVEEDNIHDTSDQKASHIGITYVVMQNSIDNLYSIYQYDENNNIEVKVSNFNGLDIIDTKEKESVYVFLPVSGKIYTIFKRSNNNMTVYKNDFDITDIEVLCGTQQLAYYNKNH